MTREHGKRTQRQVPPAIDQDTDPQARNIGASARTQGVPSPIPGGRPHLNNPPIMRQQAPVPEARPEHRGIMAHGVTPDTHTTRERAEFERGPNALKGPVPHYRHPKPPEPPVAVRIVQEAPSTIRTAIPRHVTLAAAGGEPVRLCGIDPTRVSIRLLNEDTASNIRFANLPGELAGGGGALLPWPNNSYLDIPTQDELWAISADTGTPTVSIIQVFDRSW